MKNNRKITSKEVRILRGEIQNALAKKQFQGEDRFSILVIDDDKVFSRYLNLAISAEFENVFVQVCNSGQDAIEEILDNPPEIIILDINMPKLSGYKMAKIINDIHEQGIPTLFISADRNAKNEIEALSISSRKDFLPKPIDKNELNRKITQLIKKVA